MPEPGVTVTIEASGPWDRLRRLARVTALKRAIDGRLHADTWWRGPILYELIRRYRPAHVLEFGTGRGYGAVCMATASIDADFPCTVWTVDMVPPEAPQETVIDEGDGPATARLSVAEIWRRHIPAEVAARIRCLTGDSVAVMAGWRRSGRPRVQFCFLDGGHDFVTVKHDFIAALRVADRGCAFLFDDYTQRATYGVRRLVDREIRPRLPAGAVEILDGRSRDRTIRGEDVAHELALVRGEHLGTEPLAQFYTGPALARFAARLAATRAVRRVRARASALAGRR